MDAYVYKYACMYVYKYTYTCMYVGIYAYCSMYACMCELMFICMDACMDLFMINLL